MTSTARPWLGLKPPVDHREGPECVRPAPAIERDADLDAGAGEAQVPPASRSNSSALVCRPEEQTAVRPRGMGLDIVHQLETQIEI